MFDENFSFLASASQTFTSYPIEELSPCTSRSSSPEPRHGASHSQPLQRRDSRFDNYRTSWNSSISVLTTHFQHHNLSHDKSIPASPAATTSSSDTFSTKGDEAFFDGLDTPSTSDYSSDFEPSLWDLN